MPAVPAGRRGAAARPIARELRRHGYDVVARPQGFVVDGAHGPRDQSRNSLDGTARAFGPGAAVPGRPDWQAIPTPGHTPGHVAFFRSRDRVLITGDAVLTVNLNSVRDLLPSKHQVSGPPRISTWNWQAAKESVAVLARLEPDIMAGGPGPGQSRGGPAEHLTSFSGWFSWQPASSN